MTNNVLAEIIKHKRKEVDLKKEAVPLKNFQYLVLPSKRSLKQALSHQYSDFIFECKKASPSKGLIRKNFDINEILSHYKKTASAVSVLTDKKYFQGDFSFLKQASEILTVPILCKDFFIDAYQVYEARLNGADAILLMLSVLNDEEYKKLADIADSLQLDVLTEVHSEEELDRAINLNAAIIGINNRDLKTLNIDLKTTEKLVHLIDKKYKRKDRIIISESGINTHQDVKKIASLVDGFLVGSSIMEKSNIEEHCKSLVFGNVKICGITNKKDMEIINQSGAIYAGFIFYKQSKRYINPEKAKEIADHCSLKRVGVFVNETIDHIVKLAKEIRLSVIQLHGDEDDLFISHLKITLKSNAMTCKIWKAIRVKDASTLNHQIINYSSADKILLDTYSADEYGGSGQKFDWQILENLSNKKRNTIILAGGINPENVVEATKQNTFAIDLNSGVEKEPGLKCEKKINQLFKTVRC